MALAQVVLEGERGGKKARDESTPRFARRIMMLSLFTVHLFISEEKSKAVFCLETGGGRLMEQRHATVQHGASWELLMILH